MNWGLIAHTSRASEQARWPLCSYREATEYMRPLLPRLCPKQPRPNGAGELESWETKAPS